MTLGNTSFLHELVTEALEQGTLTNRRHVSFWTGNPAPGPRLSEVVHDRLGRLDEPRLRAVRLLALGGHLPLAPLVALAGKEPRHFTISRLSSRLHRLRLWPRRHAVHQHLA